jgi:GDPmannose 4,6-dehydratase
VDWGYTPDYVNAMSRILRLPEADEFIIATGVKHTVQEFVEIAFGCLGLDWQKYVSEQGGILKRSIPQLLGNPQKLMLKTGWKPSVSFREMIAIMVRQVELDG